MERLFTYYSHSGTMKIAYFAYEHIHPGHLLWLYVLGRNANTSLIYVNRSMIYDIIDRGRYDVGISEGLKSTSYALLLKTMLKIRRLYMVALSPAIISWKFLTLSKLVDGIIAVSSLVKSVIREYEYEGPIYVLHPSPPDLAEFLLIKPNLKEPNICFIGAPIYVKGFDRLPSLIKRVRNSIPQARLIVIGGELNSEGVMSFGWVSRRELKKLLSMCSVYVHPARFDASPISVLEAMAAGIVPVVTPATGMSGIVSKVDPSLVVRFDEMPNRVVELLKSDLSALSKRCKIKAIEHHYNVIREVYSFFNEILRVSENEGGISDDRTDF
ncbi:MAG: hypothetical protein B7O98_08960 [Zestosphaera tikiterensis]|uniref:Glycosyl transferase family 1 domain-containing protein n=1 Tax=Zestosphaera tikiterensis TaxID=1973259 RepID=A0A2R7Y2A0_9CREN|nr:MAG: hypothetical protein B7O98_08960 [Zestosphaera tikiterensis]